MIHVHSYVCVRKFEVGKILCAIFQDEKCHINLDLFLFPAITSDGPHYERMLVPKRSCPTDCTSHQEDAGQSKSVRRRQSCHNRNQSGTRLMRALHKKTSLKTI